MHWLVDGMNVIGSRPDGWWRDRAGARRRLIADLGRVAAHEGVDSVAVVFDGACTPDDVAAGADAGVKVSFAGRGANAADRAIVETVEGCSRPQSLTVVTSDAALAVAVRAAGATVAPATTFRRELGG